MKVYLDNCCYNRLLDDRSYSRIFYERNSVMLILELAETGEIEIVGSEMLVREIDDTFDVYKKNILQMVYSLCKEEIRINGYWRCYIDDCSEIEHYKQ